MERSAWLMMKQNTCTHSYFRSITNSCVALMRDTSCFNDPLFCCSDQLRRHHNLHQYWLEVDLNDLSSFDELLAEKLIKQPTDHLPLVGIFRLVFFIHITRLLFQHISTNLTLQNLTQKVQQPVVFHAANRINECCRRCHASGVCDAIQARSVLINKC